MFGIGKPPSQSTDSSPNKKTDSELACTFLMQMYFAEFALVQVYGMGMSMK